jgi:hypothetical protein
MSSEITRKDLDALESYADKLFKSVGIDVNFTRHFLDRANDPRNNKQITLEELIRLFREEYVKYGKKIAQMGPDSEAVMKDMRTDINVPFVLNWNRNSKELELSAKTVMRKKNFLSKDPILTISENNVAGSGNIAGLGVGIQGEPGRSSGLVFKRGKFAGKETIVVPSKIFHTGRISKKKGQHWSKYFEEQEGFGEIREYARNNPKKSIILQDENTGALYVARYGQNV